MYCWVNSVHCIQLLGAYWSFTFIFTIAMIHLTKYTFRSQIQGIYCPTASYYVMLYNRESLANLPSCFAKIIATDVHKIYVKKTREQKGNWGHGSLAGMTAVSPR